MSIIRSFRNISAAKYVLDLKDDDIYWCTADPGWVTGTSYGIIGPWAIGVTQCVLDAGFKAESLVPLHRKTPGHASGTRRPTAIRSLMKEGDEIVKKFDLSCLRHLCSVGEPLNAEAVLWSKKVFGLMFHDTFWQTETGSMMITNYPTMKIKPGSMGKPFPGITATVVDLKTHEPITKAGHRRPDRHQARLAVHVPHLLEQRGRSTKASSRTAGTSAATAPASTRTATSGSWAATTT